MQDAGLRTAQCGLVFLWGCNSALRIPYSAFPIQAARSGILRASGRFVMAVR